MPNPKKAKRKKKMKKVKVVKKDVLSTPFANKNTRRLMKKLGRSQ